MSASGDVAVRWVARTVLLVGLVGCRTEIDGATPHIDSVNPKLVCETGGKRVEVRGDGFSPMAWGAFEDYDEGWPALPSLYMVRTADLDGIPIARSLVTFTLRPASSQPDAGVGGQDALWHSQRLISFDPVRDMFSGGQPIAGVQTIWVRNPNEREAVMDAALTVVPAPRVDTLAPSTVRADADTQLVLIGDYFLRGDGGVPTVQAGDQALPIASLADCRVQSTLAGFEVCTSATVTITHGTLSRGVLGIRIVGPEPLSCVHEPTTGPALTVH